MADWKRVLTAEGDIATHQNDKITLAQLFAGIEAGGATAGGNQILKANADHNALVWADDSGGIAVTDLSIGAENTPAGNGAIAYDNAGVFSYTPPTSATASVDGLATSTQITKLDGIEANADNYGKWTFGGDTSAGGLSNSAFQITNSETFTIAGGDSIATHRTNNTLTINNEDPCDETHVKNVLANLDSGDTLNIGDSDNDTTVNIRGNLTVSGTTTTIDTTNLVVDDKTITIANGAANVGAASGSGVIVDMGSTASEMPDFIWLSGRGAGNTDGSGTANGLTGWTLSNSLTSNFASHPIAIMDFDSDGAASSDNGAGIGSFHLDTTNQKLYIRTA